ncbi:MAG TPA: aldo/keto reductase, partial [Sulfurimonas sp.]|nr:aldo/keto reductase [Sulfurimonas sp.]
MPANMPAIIYGTAWKKESTKDLVIQAVKTGFKGIDTACQPKHYNEAGVGEALVALEKEGYFREELFIQTKFTLLEGQDPLDVPYDKAAELDIQVAQSFEMSKKNLHTDYVDSLVLHSPPNNFEELHMIWKEMEEIAIRGEAKQLGISNLYDIGLLADLYQMAKIKPSVVQNRFYKDTHYDKQIRKFCKDHNITYQSFWTLTANPHLLKNQKLIDLAIRYNKNVVQIFFAYLNHIGITPLTGTTDLEHMQIDLESFDINLEKDDILKLDSLF